MIMTEVVVIIFSFSCHFSVPLLKGGFLPTIMKSPSNLSKMTLLTCCYAFQKIGKGIVTRLPGHTHLACKWLGNQVLDEIFSLSAVQDGFGKQLGIQFLQLSQICTNTYNIPNSAHSTFMASRHQR
jgi:hypothetical protein